MDGVSQEPIGGEWLIEGKVCEGLKHQRIQQQRGSALEAEGVELVKAAGTGKGEHTPLHRLGVGVGIVRKPWRVFHRSAKCQTMLWLACQGQGKPQDAACSQGEAADARGGTRIPPWDGGHGERAPAHALVPVA